MIPRLRKATVDDAPQLEVIENAADALLIERLGATSWPPAAAGRDRLEADGAVMIAEVMGQPVGFVHLLEVDGQAHLEQLSVLPAHGRRGYGRLLVRAALREAGSRGHRRVTLRTYADVPWNAPFYASCGFLESLPETPFQRRLIDVESQLGLDRLGRRVQMTALTHSADGDDVR